jgi:DHA1 family bicyclomycin/chloramphenicol resistance-like MFS transporter
MLESALAGPTARSRLGQRESVVLLAALMALNAIGIDAMLPALPAIARQFRVASENDQQLVIILYMLGFGVGQLFWGPLGDRFGRRPMLVTGLSLYALLALGCGFATSFTWLLAGRVAMGAVAASTRVLVIAMVRDLFEGEAMARVMSLVFMIFMVVPVVAPSLGQAVLAFAPWQAIFIVLAIYALGILGWAFVRLPETLHPEDQRSLDPSVILQGVRLVVQDRLAIGYTLAGTALFGALSAYVATMQQITADVFHAAQLVPLVFAACAAPMSAAAFTNSRIVGRFGLRRVGHVGLIALVAVGALHWALAVAGQESLGLFIVLQGVALVAFALCSSNFGALAMTNMGHLAGTASSVQGVISTVGGALIGLVIGRAFDGTVVPYVAGLTLTACAALVIVAVTERGRLLEPLPAG